jgi:hypothetical protein
MGLPFTIDAGPPQCSHSQIRMPRDSWPHFTVSNSRLPHSWGPGPRIYTAKEQGGPVRPQALDSLFFASYDSQGYGGGIQPRLYTFLSVLVSVWYDEGRIDNSASDSSYIVPCVFVAAGRCLSGRCLAVPVSSCSTIKEGTQTHRQYGDLVSRI